MNLKQPSRPSRTWIILLVGVLGFLLLNNFIVNSLTRHPEQINYTEFLELLKAPKGDPSKIEELIIQEGEILGKRTDGSQFKTYGPVTPDLQALIVEKGITITFLPPPQPSILGQLMMSLIPIIIFALLFMWLMRKSQGGGNSMSMFGKSKVHIADDDNKVTFDEVAGVDEAKEELVEVVEFLKDPSQFTKLGAKIPKGVLLIGGPGNGKTLLAKAVANEAKVPFLSISGSDFVEMFVGVGASRVRDLFEQARKNAPCIIFIDEIDAVGRQRGSGHGGGHDEREQTLNQLLIEMDGFVVNEGVIVMAATNRVDVLDPALLRPGRFDRQVFVSAPDTKGRLGILRIHSRKVPMALDIDLEKIAKGTPGFSGADLESLINEAAIMAAREKTKDVENRHLELAKDKVIMGPARKSMIITDHDKKITAYHEVGHALVARFTKGADPVHKVTIVPRGKALGVTMLLPNEDKLSISKEQAQATIDYAMGGRAAEELIFGHFTTGASSDIKKATQMARRMVCEWGMGQLGPISLTESTSDPFSGRDKQNNHSESLLQAIDAEVQELVNSGYKRALEVLRSNKELLDKLSLALFERETLLSEEIDHLILGNQKPDSSLP